MLQTMYKYAMYKYAKAKKTLQMIYTARTKKKNNRTKERTAVLVKENGREWGLAELESVQQFGGVKSNSRKRLADTSRADLQS